MSHIAVQYCWLTLLYQTWVLILKSMYIASFVQGTYVRVKRQPTVLLLIGSRNGTEIYVIC